MQKQRENSGILFRNDRKEADSHPDYVGSINVGGTEFYLNAWLKQGQKAKFMSLSIKPKDAARVPAPARDEIADEIPF